MDFGIPDLSTGREPASDPTRRRDKADGADFAAMLDQSLDAPEEPRERAPAKANEPASGEKVREKPRRSEHVENERANTDNEAADAPAGPPAQDAAERPSAEKRETATDAAPAPAESADAADVANAATNPESQPAAPATPQVAAMPQQTPSADAKGPKVAPVAPAAPTGAAPPTDATGQTEVPSNGAAKEPQTVAAQPAFAEQLANAAGKPAEAAPAKSNAKNDPSPSVENGAKPATVETTTAAAITATTGASSDNRPQRDASNGNPAMQMPAAPATPAAPQAAPAAAAPSPAQAAEAPAAPAPADDAEILAVIRTAPQAAAASRPTTPDATNPVPADDFQKTLPADAKATAEATKTDAPRPFGALAPGLGLAAQITAQQTPEQANAAERLAQLAAATAEPAAKIKSDSEPAKPADTTAPALRADQPAPVDTPAARQAAADVAETNAAARSARPNFHPVVTQVAAQMAQAAADGTDRINIRLSPAELGRIDVKLDFGPDGRVQAVFAAERPQTMELLQRDARDLERALQDAGLRADSGSLSFNLRGNGRDNRDDQTPGGGRNDATPADIAATQLQAYSAGTGGSGRLDIRI